MVFCILICTQNPLKMDNKTILQKIKNDPYFIEWMNDRFGEQASNHRQKMTEAETLADEEIILIREWLDAIADNMAS